MFCICAVKTCCSNSLKSSSIPVSTTGAFFFSNVLIVLALSPKEEAVLTNSIALDTGFLLSRNQKTTIATTAIANIIDTDFFTEQLPPIHKLIESSEAYNHRWLRLF